MVCAAGDHQGRGEDGSAVLSVRETGPGEEVVLRCIIGGYRGAVLGNGGVLEVPAHGRSEKEDGTE